MKGLKLICFILLCVSSNFEVSTTTVTIHGVGSLRDTGSVRCGSKVTFICSIPTYTYHMVWLIDSDKVAECVTTNCVQYPPYKLDNIEFSANTRMGQFNMTINPVTLEADERTIKCSYGSEGVQLKLAVKVFPTQNTTKIVESQKDNDKMIKITAMTGCVFPRSAITMQWYYYEEGHKPKLYKTTAANVASNVSVCNHGPCGGNGEVKISSTLSIPKQQKGKDFFFEVAIGHEDTGEIILLNSTRSYKINGLPFELRQEPAVPVDDIEQHKFVLPIIGVIMIILGMVGMMVRKMLISRKHKGQTKTYIEQCKKEAGEVLAELIEQKKKETRTTDANTVLEQVVTHGHRNK